MESRKWVLTKHGGPDGLELVNFKCGEPGPNEVLIRVICTTATYTDHLIMKGNYMPSPPLPLTPGYDLIGVVVKCGANVPSTLEIGSRVAAMPQSSCMTTHIILEHRHIVKVDSGGVPSSQVSCIRTGVTAYQMLFRCCASRIKKPEEVTMLIHSATGAMGTFLLSLALASGFKATNIYGTCSGKNLSILSAFGINALNYEKDDWSKVILERTAGLGVDLIFDAVNLQSYYGRGMACLKNGGKYVSYGFTNLAEAGSMFIPDVLLFFMRISFQQYLLSFFDRRETEFYIIASKRDENPMQFTEDLKAVMNLVSSNKIVPVIGKIWPFTRAKEALQSIAQNSHVGLQVVQVDE